MNKQISPSLAPFLLLLTLITVSGCGVVGKKIASLKKSESTSKTVDDQTKVTASSSKIDASLSLVELAISSNDLLKKRKYEDLRSKIDKARETQERLPGGYWKLYALYEGLSSPNYKKNATASEWEQHIARLTEWKTTMPDSITARVALSGALINYGFEARGGDTIDKISDESMRTFLSRIEAAEQELSQAKDLSPKCPRWHELMLNIGLAQSWSRAKYDQVFEEGFRLAPTYYHLHRQKITYLLPQWNGRQGDIAKFVENVSERMGGDEGSIMYYELSAVLWPQYRSYIWGKTGLDPAKAKVGYDAMKRIYGVDRYRKNLLMAMAMTGMGGVELIEESLKEVGDDWDEDVWGTKQAFEERKAILTSALEMRENIAERQTQNSPPVSPSR